MKKIFLLVLLFVSFSASAQRFPSVDSLKNYILRYVKNSATESFTNLRMQNVVYGLTEFFQTNGIDTIWKSGDTLKYRKNGVNRTVGVFTGGGGSTDTTSLSNRINLKLNITDTSAMLSPYAQTSEVPAQFNPIAGTNVSLSGSYPNITFNASGGGGGSQTLQQTTVLGNTSTKRISVGGEIPNYGTSIEVGGYNPIQTSAANLGSAQNYFALNFYQASRIRQNTLVNKVQIYLASVPVRLSSFHIYVWRKRIGGNGYDIVKDMEVLSSLTSGTNTLTVTPFAVQEGDNIGYSWTSSGAGSDFLTTFNSAVSQSTYYTTATPTSYFEWVGLSSINTYVPIKMYSDESPMAVFIGNSITSGNNMFSAYVNAFAASGGDSLHYSMPYLVARHFNWTNQNMGISNEQSVQVVARFTQDVINKKPRVAIIMDGINDVGTVSPATTVANWNTYMAQCTTANIKMILLSITPWTAGNTQKNRTRDSLNLVLAGLATTYGAIWVQLDTVLGQFRSGGDAGNYWDIKDYYSQDGVHYNYIGYAAMANEIIRVVELANYQFPFPATEDTMSIMRVQATSKGFQLPSWNWFNTNLNNYTVPNGTIAFRRDTVEAMVLKTSQGIKDVLTTDNLTYGTRAQRVALTPVTGTHYFQTDELIGDYRYNGAEWVQILPNAYINQRMLNATGSTAPTGSVINYVGDGGANNVNNDAAFGLNNTWIIYTGSSAGTGAYLKTGNTYAAMFAARNYVVHQKVRLYQGLATGSETNVSRFGVGALTAANNDNGFTGFKYSHDLNSGNWQLVSGNGATTVNTTIPVAASTTYDLVIVFSATSGFTKFYINGEYAGQISTSTVNSFYTLISSVYKTNGTYWGWFIERHVLYEY